MSYNDNSSVSLTTWQPATPMVLDVIALQYLYGPNNSTNLGNTTYQLTLDQLYATFWDAAGIDTISVAGTAVGWTIFLPFHQFSSKVPTKAGVAIPTLEYVLETPLNLKWLMGALENVNGSSLGDIIHGNELANVLNAGAGNDVVNGNAANDTLAGGAGNDTLDGGDWHRHNGGRHRQRLLCD